MAEVIWLPAALENLRKIRQYIAASSPHNADRVVTEVFEKPFVLLDHPHAGPRIDEDKFSGMRQLLCYSYRILYRTEPELHVVGVLHGARQLPPEMLRRR